MIDQIKFSYPTEYLVLCAVLALALTVLLYWKDQKFNQVKTVWKWVLAALRFLSSFLIALFLLTPFIKIISEDIQKPIVVYAQDESSSMAINKGQINEDYFEKRNQLLDQLNSDYELLPFSFGNEVKSEIQDSFLEKSTNISALLNFIGDQYGDQNLGAVILATDGIYNEGSNPIYRNEISNAPFYPIAFGDSTLKKDVLIKNLFHNKIAYLGDKFPVQVDIESKGFSGAKLTVDFYEVKNNQNNKIDSKTININRDQHFSTVEFLTEAKQVGNIKYFVRVSSLNGEFSTSNNRKSLHIDIIDSRQKFLLLAHAAHPDVTALKAIIESNKNYQLDIKYADESIGDLKSYDLILLHSLPSEKFPVSNVLRSIEQNNISSLFITGSNTSIARFNAAQDVLSIASQTSALNESQAVFNEGFSSFGLDDKELDLVESLPPLTTHFGEHNLGATAKTVFNQRIKDIDTDEALILVQDQSNIKTGIIAGEGIWKWRLINYLQLQNHEAVDNIFARLFQYLSTKEDKRRFRTNISQNVFKETDHVVIDAQLYNDNFELVNDAEVQAVIRQGNSTFNFTFSRKSNYYILDAGRLAPGNYSYEASTNFNGEQLSSKGNFTVQDVELEQFDLTANHSLLYELAEQTGGQVLSVDELSNVSELITNNASIKPVVYYSNSTEKLLDQKWIFFIIAFLLAFEWFIRRYLGSY